jgi:thymidine kinase
MSLFNSKNVSYYLKLVIGPMFSSKSSYLLSEYNKYCYLFNKNQIIVINSILDKQRHTNEPTGFLKTHDNKSISALMLNNLNELYTNPLYNKKYNEAKIIIIDEAQFYPDLYLFIKKELHKTGTKRFIIAGLSSDFNQNPIGDIIKLIPLADDIIKLSALCLYCKDGTPANFTKKIAQLNENYNKNCNENDNILVGNKDTYSPCCRFHFKFNS